VGLTIGTIGYYAFIALGLRVALGTTICEASKDVFSHSPWAHLGNLRDGGTLFALLPTMLAGGLALAVIASIDALLCAKLVCQTGDPRMDADQLLARLGISNMVAASFGGITSGINIGPSLINRAFGGRSPISVLVNALAILLALTVFFPIITLLPRVALSAVIMVIAIQHFDPWSLELVKRLAAGSGAQRQFLIIDFLVVALVAALSITVNIVLAVLLGTVIAIMLFVVRMSRSIVRRHYRCGTVSSRRSRHEEEVRAIERYGDTILVMELQGALFFGTGERLIDEILKATRQKTASVILDLRRLSYIDTTGARILLEIRTDLSGSATNLGLVLPSRNDIAMRLKDFGVLEKIPDNQTFEDVDRAIEWAEEELIRKVLGNELSATQEVPLEDVGILQNFALEEISALKPRLKRVTYAKGDVIFQQGDSGDELFMVIQGMASAYIRQVGGREIRLVTFTPGTVFGELAILDEGPRSASVVADDNFASYSLSREQFSVLSSESPAVAIKLLGNLGRELSGRLRRADRMIDELET
jgi:MFS superfamily sulfate permease-like transporter